MNDHTCEFPGCTKLVDADVSYCRAHASILDKTRNPPVLRVAQLTQRGTSDLSTELKVIRHFLNTRLATFNPDNPNDMLAFQPDLILLVDLISRIAQSNHKILKETGSMLTEQQAIIIVDGLCAILKDELSDMPERLARIQIRLNSVIKSVTDDTSQNSDRASN